MATHWARFSSTGNSTSVKTTWKEEEEMGVIKGFTGKCSHRARRRAARGSTGKGRRDTQAPPPRPPLRCSRPNAQCKHAHL